MKALCSYSVCALAVCLAIVFGLCPVSWAATVKKDISKDTVWSARKSPYVVKENVMLMEGATLTIEPGVRVELAAGKSIQVRGNFRAIGKPDKPIVFTALDNEPWENVYFTDFCPDAVLAEDGSYVEGSIMKHCIVEKGRGIYVRFGAPLITECDIRDNLSSGIRVEFGAPKIIKNRIHDNSTQPDSASGNGGGIIAYTDKPALIDGNIIYDNVSDGGRDGGGGIYIYAADGAKVVATNNTVYGNTSSRFGGGIYAYGGFLGGNTIIGNESVERGGGIYAVESEVSGNTVQNNSSGRGGGLYAESCDVNSNNIVRNNARRPEGGAMYYFGSGNITANCIIANTAGKDGGCGGIYVSGDPDIRENNMFNNSGYALRVANVSDAPEVLAASNFWGTTSEQAILGFTYDWLDSEETGLASYIPYLEKAADNTPPLLPANLTAAATGNGIKLSWDKPLGTSPDGHMIHIGTKSGYPYERIIPASAKVGYEVTGLSGGTEYWVTVSAYKTADGKKVESGLSEEIRVAIGGPTEALAEPRNVAPENKATAASESVTLKASDPAPGAVASRWQVSTIRSDFSALALDRVQTGEQISMLEIGADALLAGQQYYWRVAYGTSEGSWSGWSRPTSFSTSADSPSVVSGPIASAITFEKRFSPYELVGNTLIMPEGILTIEPGVEVRIAPGKNLMVRGSLVARGTDANPIKFTKQTSENWGQMIFADQSVNCNLDEDGNYGGGCILEKCVIEHGKGLIIASSSPLIKACDISNTKGSGITVRQGGPVITGNDIHHNKAVTNGGGVYAYTNDIIFVAGNKIHDNTADGDGGGVYAYGYMNTSTIRVENNQVFANSATGDGGGVYLSRSSAIGNKISGNAADGNGGGIFATFGLIETNDLRDNQAEQGGGIYAERNSSLTGNLVTTNKSLSGFGGGVYINFWGISIDNEAFTQNTVTDNVTSSSDGNGGVFIVGYLFFERNNIYGNSGSQLYNGNESDPRSYSLLTTQCYWGTDDKGAISKLIVDGSDDPDLGMVSFEPFSPTPLQFD
jgi:hypothetical protein